MENNNQATSLTMTEAEIFKRRVEIFIIGVFFLLCAIAGILFALQEFSSSSTFRDPVYRDYAFEIPRTTLSVFSLFAFSWLVIALGGLLRVRWTRIAAIIMSAVNIIPLLYFYIGIVVAIRLADSAVVLRHRESIEHCLGANVVLAFAVIFALIIIFMLGQRTEIAMRKINPGGKKETIQTLNKKRIIWGVVVKYLIILAGIVLLSKGIDILVTGIV